MAAPLSPNHPKRAFRDEVVNEVAGVAHVRKSSFNVHGLDGNFYPKDPTLTGLNRFYAQYPG